MKKSFKKLFLIISSLLLSAHLNGCPVHIENPKAYRDLFAAVYASDPVEAEKAFAQGGITISIEQLELAQNIVSIHVMKMIAGVANQQEADNAFATLKVIVKDMEKRVPTGQNDDKEASSKIQHLLKQSFNQFYAENSVNFRLSNDQRELALAIVKVDLEKIKNLAPHLNTYDGKQQIKNLCLLMLQIQNFKVSRKYANKTTPLTVDDLSEEDLRILEIAEMVYAALTIDDPKENVSLPAKWSPLEFYEKFRYPPQDGKKSS